MPPKKKANAKKRKNEAEENPKPTTFGMSTVADGSPPVPSLVLADALLFADTMAQVLQILAQGHDRWMEAIVLATPFWKPEVGRLNVPLRLEAGIPPLIAASMRFDPDRELKIGSLAPRMLNSFTKQLLASARRILILHSFQPAFMSSLIELIPNLTAVHFSVEMPSAIPPLESLPCLTELAIHECNTATDLSFLGQLKSLRKITLHTCTALTDISALASFANLVALDLGGCTNLMDVSPIALLDPVCNAAPNLTVDVDDFDSDTAASLVPVELFGSYAALLRSEDPSEVERGTLMIRKIISVDRNPWSYNEDTPLDVIPPKMLYVYIDLMHSTDSDYVRHGAVMVRYQLSSSEYDFTVPALEEGCAAVCAAHLLRDDLPDLQELSAQILKDMAWTIPNGGIMISTPHVVDNLIRLLEVTNDKCCHAGAVAIGELCRDDTMTRDTFLGRGTLQPLLSHITDGDVSDDVYYNDLIWAVARIADAGELPDFELIAPALPVMADILFDSKETVPSDAVWCVSGLFNGPEDQIQRVLDCGLLGRLVEFISDGEGLTCAAIEAVRLIATRGSSKQMQSVLDAGAMATFPRLVDHPDDEICRRTCLAVAAIAGRGTEGVQMVVDAKLVVGLVRAIEKRSDYFQEAALSAIRTMASEGSRSHIDHLVENDVLVALAKVIKEGNKETQPIALSAFDSISKMLSSE